MPSLVVLLLGILLGLAIGYGFRWAGVPKGWPATACAVGTACLAMLAMAVIR